MTKITWYNELAIKAGSIEERECDIRATAANICKTRREYANAIAANVSDIQKEAEQINTFIREIRHKYDILDEIEKRNIETKCGQLENALKDYVEKSANLCTRFKNQKIKIVAFGPKSQGKSTFTGLYTGLNDEVVAVKKAGNDDKTGATSVIIHSNDVVDIKIKVFQKSQEEILAMINSSLTALKELNLSIKGTNHGIYKSWADFKRVLDNKEQKKSIYEIFEKLKNTQKVENFNSNRAVLKNVFRAESDFSQVKPDRETDRENGIEISLEDLPMYNDMQHKGTQRFMTVSLIKIFKDLERQNMFENFEICDTKGLSVDAGGSTHEDAIYKELNEADAVFSIYMLKTGDASDDFYDKLANRINLNHGPVKPLDFDSKHFVILNIAENGFLGSTPEVADNIQKENIANTVYIGALRNGVYDNIEIDAKKFVDSLLLDMLGSIVENTKNNDKALVAKCNELVLSINASKKELIDCLSDIKIEKYSINGILRDKIDGFRREALRKIEEMAKDHNSELNNIKLSDVNDSGNAMVAPSDEDDEEDEDGSYGVPVSLLSEDLSSNMPKVDDKQRNVQMYKMITARYGEDDEEIAKKLEGKTSTEVSNAAISDILDKIKGVSGSCVYMGANRELATKVTGTANDIGGYIDSVSDLLQYEIKENINRKYTGSQDITPIIKLRDELYDSIWKIFKFDKLYHIKFSDLLKQDNDILGNKIISEWIDYYTKDKKNQEASSIIPEVSYNILIAYFSGLEYIPAVELGAEPIVDWKKLKQAICEVYSKFDFKERVLEKLTNDKKLERNLFVDLRGSLMGSNFIGDLIAMYIKRSPQELKDAEIIEGADYNKILHSGTLSALCAIKDQLKSQEVTSLEIKNN